MKRPAGVSDRDWIEHLEFLLREIMPVPSDICPQINGIRFAPAEARILGALLKRGGSIMQREALLAAACADMPDGDWPDIKVLDVYICRIRAKLRAAKSDIVIKTIHRIGYTIGGEE